MSVKARFTFIAEASPTDPRTTIVCVRYLQFDEDELDTLYAFPDNLVGIENHDQLMKLPSAKTAKKNLNQRGKKRTVRITLPADIAALYRDDDGNPVFAGEMLDEEHVNTRTTVSPVAQKVEEKSLKSIMKDAVIPKYGSASHNVNIEAWLNLFESECKRLKLPETEYSLALRLFLENSAEKWYESTRLTTVSTSWDFWRNSFVENFGQTGWSAARSAFAFRYISGSLSEYAQTKMNMLVSFNPKMDSLTLIAQIVCGLPLTLQERIDITEIGSVGKLMSKINSFNPLPPRNFASPSKPSTTASTTAFASLKRTLCGYCKKKGFDRYHAEEKCFTKIRENKFTPNINVKTNESKAINNIENDDLTTQIMQELKNE